MHVRTLPSRFRPFLELLESRELLSTFFVDTNNPLANDSNNGLSDGTAWKTLQRAANVVNAGDQVIVRAGNYKGFELTRDGASGAAITFSADVGVIINQAANTRGHGINLEGASWVVIEGFRVEGGGGTAITRAGIRSVENDHVTIRNNISNANGYWGILTGFCDFVTIEGNTTTNSVNEHGIYVSNSCVNPIIRNNTIFGNRANGIHMNGDRFTSSSVGKPLTGLITGALVENNIIYNNGVGGGSAINGDGLQTSIIRNNLIYNTHASGISLYMIDGSDGAKNNLVVNNTILVSSTGRWALNIMGGSTGNTVFNNIFHSAHSFRGAVSVSADSLSGYRSDYNVVEDRMSADGGNTGISLVQWRAQTGQDANSVVVGTLASLFVNQAGNDYHLAAGSLARDRGIGSFNGKSAPTVDRDGLPRPSASAYDVGAYEFQATSGTPGSLQFSAASYSVNENGGTATITVTRTGGSTGSVSVQYATSNGSATAGSDYTAASGTLTFANGETSKTFSISILNDALLEGSESLNLTLSNPTGGATLGSQTTAVVTINDDETAQPGVLQFSAATYGVNENGGTATITVTRTGGSNVAVSVQVATSNGSATAGSDYTAASGILSFAVGETSKTFGISILNDALLEGNETINLTLSNPTGGATLGSQSTALVTISDDETAQPGVLQFSAASYSVNENGGTATITVTRTGGSNVAVSVQYATSNGSATASSDYTAASGTLTFANGEISKTFSISILNDALLEGNETINLTLSNPTGGATLGSQSTAVVTISDDETAQPGVLQFGAASYSVNENGGTATITVTRTGGSNVAVSVQYATSNGTATTGTDYTAASGTLSFGVGETSKTFTVAIINDTTVESPETINLTLSNPTAGATLGSQSTATLSIQSDDVTPPTGNPFLQDSGSNGLVVIEAENYHANVTQGGKTWSPYTVAGYSGTGALQAMPNTGVNQDTGYVTSSPRLDYQVQFNRTGTHYVWIRGRGPTGSDDSLHVGLNGAALASADRVQLTTGYGWTRSTMDGVMATINVTSVGVHTINVWMREDGAIVDKLLLTSNASYTPTGVGPAESPRAAATGLQATYFDNVNFTGASVSRIDPGIAFNWGNGAPAAGIAADTFSTRWTGKIQPRYTETYTFTTTSDDGVRLWVNGQLLIDQWNDHSATAHSGTIALQAGQLYDIRVEYYENGGQAVMQLEWASASQTREIVPASRLFSA